MSDRLDPGTERVSAVVTGTVTANAGTGTFGSDTELPTAAALADGTANPTTPLVGTASAVFNGTTWDRLRGDVNNGADVDVTRTPKSSTVSAHAQTAVGTTGVQILAANTSRKFVMVQNTGTTIIRLSLTATDPTATSYHIALKAGTAADDGTGGLFTDDMWQGVIRAISSAAGGTVVVAEVT